MDKKYVDTTATMIDIALKQTEQGKKEETLLMITRRDMISAHHQLAWFELGALYYGQGKKQRAGNCFMNVVSNGSVFTTDPEEEKRYDTLTDICLSEQMTEVIEKREEGLKSHIHIFDEIADVDVGVVALDLLLLDLGKYSYGWDVSLESRTKETAYWKRDYEVAETRAREATESVERTTKLYQEKKEELARIMERKEEITKRKEDLRETAYQLGREDNEKRKRAEELKITYDALKKTLESMTIIAKGRDTKNDTALKVDLSSGEREEKIKSYERQIQSVAKEYGQVMEEIQLQSSVLSQKRILKSQTEQEERRIEQEINRLQEGIAAADVKRNDETARAKEAEQKRVDAKETLEIITITYEKITTAAKNQAERVRKKITGFIERKDYGSADFTRRRVYLETVLNLAKAVEYGQNSREENLWADAVYEFYAVRGRIEINDAETMGRVLAIKEQRRKGGALLVLEEIEQEVLFNYTIVNYAIEREKQKSELAYLVKDYQGSLGIIDTIITQATVISNTPETDAVKNAAEQTKNLIILYNWGQANHDKISEEDRAGVKLFCMEEMYRITAPDAPRTVWSILYAQLLNERTKQMIGE